jgi:hypothetical protein
MPAVRECAGILCVLQCAETQERECELKLVSQGRHTSKRPVFNNGGVMQVPYTLTVVSPPSVNYESASNMEVVNSGPNGIGNLTAVLPDMAIPSGTNLKANVTFTVNATNQVSSVTTAHEGKDCRLAIAY